jgi:hypothetical protein
VKIDDRSAPGDPVYLCEVVGSGSEIAASLREIAVDCPAWRYFPGKPGIEPRGVIDARFVRAAGRLEALLAIGER